MRAYFQAVLKYRWVVLIAVLGVTAWLGSFLWPVESIKYDFSFNRLFIQYGGDQDRLREFNQDFGDDVGMVSVLVALPDATDTPPVSERVTGTVFAPRVLRQVIALGDELKERPELNSEQVISIGAMANLQSESIAPDFMRSELKKLDEAVAGQPGLDSDAALAAAEGLGPADTVAKLPAAIKAAAERYRKAAGSIMKHRLYVGQLVSPDGRSTRVLGRFRLDYQAPEKRHPLLSHLDERSKAFEREVGNGARVYYTGIPIIERDYARITLTDLALFTPIIGAVICLFLLMLFRSVWAIVGGMTPIGLATVWGVGFMQWQGEPINVVNNTIPVLILVIGVAESVHILARYYQVATEEEDKREAIIKAMCAMTPACFLASFTTGVGFASLVSASIPAIRGFGIFSGAAIMFVFLMQVTVLPVVLSLLPRPKSEFMMERESTYLGRFIHWLNKLVTQKPKTVLIAAGIAAIAAGIGISIINKDMRILHELDEDHPTAQALLQTQERLGGMLVHAVAISGKEYPDRKCSVDADCKLKPCDETTCGYPGCCHTQVCRQVDRPYQLVGKLRAAGLDMTDQDEMPTFDQLGNVVRELRLRAMSAGPAGSKGKAGGDDGDSVDIEDDDEVVEEEDSDEEIVVEEDDAPSAPPANVEEPRVAPAMLGVCTESVKNPMLVKAVAQLDDWLSSGKNTVVVGQAASMVDLLKEMNLAFTGADDDANYALPKDLDRRSISQLLFPLESAGGDTLSRTVTRDYTRTNVTIYAFDSGAKAWRELEGRLQKKNDELFGTKALNGKFDVHITGNTTLAHSALSAVVTDMVTSLSVAFVFILLLMTVLFRSFKVGLYSMIPNVWPVFITMAMMGYLSIDLRVSSVIIFSVSLGIAVDDTIHFLHRMGEEIRRDDGPVDLAIERTLHGSGRAILLTTIILCMGFGAQAMSNFKAVEQFGALSAFTLGVAFFGDLFVLPALVKAVRLDKSFRKHQKRSSA